MNKNRTFAIGRMNNIDLRLLRIYKTVVECGGFSAAEASLNISGAAISIAMNDLETRLGLRLCHRGRSGFSVTDEGQKAYDSTCKVLESIEQFRTEIYEIHNHLEGELNIGMTDNLVTLSKMCITNTISNLKTREPSVRIHIKMMPPDDIEIEVLEGRLQVGVVPSMRLLKGFDYYPLYQEESLLYCGSGHPLFNKALESLCIDEIKKLDAINPVYIEKTKANDRYEELNTTATASDREGVAVFILSGNYVGYLPTHFAKQWVDDKRMKSLLPEYYLFKTEYSAIIKKDTHPSRVLQAFVEELDIVLKA
ncbi:MAG: LysR family transcriptional regulator [Oceanospirillaceae bacterium]|nr:LysR family transcriptional regulator [Oceanospirillaceae bacterium]